MDLLNFEDLARNNVLEFQFVVAALNVRKGLGSPIAPLAVC